jgi:hypothetical protein
MLELIKQKRLKDKFKREFGANIEDFFDEEVFTEESKMTDIKQELKESDLA